MRGKARPDRAHGAAAIGRQVKALEQENGRLKEDLAFFENLAAAEGKEAGFTINRLRVEPNGNPGQYRFRLLAAAQGGKKDREFRGSVQLVISLQQEGKSAMMVLPEQNDPARQRFNINFKHFQRVDGTFQVPGGARVTSVEARLSSGRRNACFADGHAINEEECHVSQKTTNPANRKAGSIA
jgi:prepilin-type processing-associated H-X9-DG protein